jgi:hypothetical protein
MAEESNSVPVMWFAAKSASLNKPRTEASGLPGVWSQERSLRAVSEPHFTLRELVQLENKTLVC